MKNRSVFFFLGMLVLALTFGLVLAGCPAEEDDSSSGGSNPFAGTRWTGTVSVEGDLRNVVLSFSTSTWTQFIGNDDASGTYTVSGNTATLTQNGGHGTATATISGNTLTASQGGQTIVLTKS